MSSQSVSFSSKAVMRMALHISHYTEEEMKACFYTRDDYYNFKQEAKQTAKKIEMKEMIDEVTVTRRGAEGITSDALQTTCKNRKAAKRVVMMQQMDQMLEDWSHDDTKIAKAYADCVRESAAVAYLTGLSDELVVKQILHDESKSLSSTPGRGSTKATYNLRKLLSTKRNALFRRHEVISNHAA